MSAGEKDGLLRLVEAITDEIPVDWQAEARDHPELADRLPALRLIERVAAVYRAPDEGEGGDGEPGGAWGPLRILEKLGEGGYGTVYRAWDPRLEREVALKLLRDDLPGGGPRAGRILAEARLMARVRHPNVLVIHGADEHDGRAGFWTDLLDGQTLEQRLAGGDVLGAGEAVLCGRELCRALGAVHAAGLVHGDVKAANVMRDREGRLVLMDFGAGSERMADPAGDPVVGPLRGTPLSLAPELFAGAPATPASDLYALGVLLYRLVSGRYPVEADSLGDLRRRHEHRERTPLLDLRPDLPVEFVWAVERALAADPARRFASAGEMEMALAGTLEPGPGPGARRRGRAAARRRLWWLALPLLAAVALRFGLPALRQAVAPAPARPLLATATFLRTGGDWDEILGDGALLRPGDTLALTLLLNVPSHVYVLNEDHQGRVYVLFPLAGSDLGNPLPGGQPLRLPGKQQGTPLSWQVTEGAGEESFLVIAAREPVPWLEEQLVRYAAPSADRRVRSPRPETAPPSADRGLGAVVQDQGPEPASATVLDGIASRLLKEASDPSAIWVKRLMLYNLGR